MDQSFKISILSQPLITTIPPTFKGLEVLLTAFNFSYNNIVFGVSVHHFLPIEKVSDVKTNERLNILVDSNWNEILLFESINNKVNLVYKDVQTKLPKVDDEITIYNKEDRIRLKVFGYQLLPYDNLDMDHNIPYIVAYNLSDINNFNSLSGSPVFINNKLVGIFSKYNAHEKIAYIIPIYILIKTIEKKDNKNIYKFPVKPKKINNYNVKNNFIYHPRLKFDIPLNTYLLLEGDYDYSCLIQDINLNINNEKTIINKELSESLLKKDIRTYLISSRFLYLCKMVLDNNIFLEIMNSISNIDIKNNLYWIYFENNNFRIYS